MTKVTIHPIWYRSELHGEGRHCEIMADRKKKDLFFAHKLHNNRQVHIFLKELWPQLQKIMKRNETLCIMAPYRSILEDLQKQLTELGGPASKLTADDKGKACFPQLVIQTETKRPAGKQKKCCYSRVCYLPITDKKCVLGYIKNAFKVAKSKAKIEMWIIGSKTMLETLGIRCDKNSETMIKSIFDYQADGDAQSRPERCFRDALESQTVRKLLSKKTIVYSELPLKCLLIRTNGKGRPTPLLEYLKEKAANERDWHKYIDRTARFDFAFVERISKRLLFAVEVDGEPHRYGYFDGGGLSEEQLNKKFSVGKLSQEYKKSQERNNENDERKNSIVESIGGIVLCGNSLPAVDGRLPKGESLPEGLALYRIPSNGSSAFEIESLKSRKGKVESSYFTLEKLILTYLSVGVRGSKLSSDSAIQILAEDSYGIKEAYGKGKMGFKKLADAQDWLKKQGLINEVADEGWFPTETGKLKGIFAIRFIPDDDPGGKARWACRFTESAIEELRAMRNGSNHKSSR